MKTSIEIIKSLKEGLPLNLQKESDILAAAFISSVANFANENRSIDPDFVFKYALTNATCKMSLDGRFKIKEILEEAGADVSAPFASENIFVICSAMLQIDSLPEKIIDERTRQEVEISVEKLKDEFSRGFEKGFVEEICEAIA